MLPRRAAIWALGAYAVLLGLIAFWPVPVDRDASDLLMRSLRKLHRWGVPRLVRLRRGGVCVERAPVLSAGRPGRPASWARGYWWGGAAAGVLLSVLIELGPDAFLPARFPSVADVAANTFGAMAGALVAMLLMARREAVRIPRPARTL